ncbi:MAG TPA: lipid-binding SYLF domain-containing protein [Pirellulales bacterium]|nr:lipid-binding SYLF domain-containing protein [Pirellulales bacterium]
MMRALFAFLAASSVVLCSAQPSRAGDPEETVRSADQVLHEIMAVPAKRIPASLLNDAQGLVIVPGVVKIGFIGGIRRGRGVVLVRDQEGQWCLPQFVTLTGGSVGWQAGIQSTDVVLVFRNARGAQRLLSGKFTIGTDASIAAGPVGRSAEAGTDARLQAEILSWSRSRGIFAGVALDGSAIEVDPGAYAYYYGVAPMQPPLHVPASAIQLLQDVNVFSGTIAQASASSAGSPNPTGDTLRRALAHNATTLNAVLDSTWQQYLRLPNEVMSGIGTPRVDDLRAALDRFDRIAATPDYRLLAERPEFQATHELLREYFTTLTANGSPQSSLPLPPPPTAAPK